VRRNLQLIASEALHNAARHADATHVSLGINVSGKRWSMWIEDDGVGIDPDAKPTGSGMGLENMRKRAKEIGAAIDIGPARRDRGTRISLRFDPRARDRRIP
jgi:signal transduction histidine kinase